MAEEAGMLHVNRLSKQFCQSAHSLVFRDADTLCTGSHDFIKVMEAFRCFFFPLSLPSLLLSMSTCTSVLIFIPPAKYVSEGQLPHLLLNAVVVQTSITGLCGKQAGKTQS